LSIDLSHSGGIAFYWWGSGGVDQQIDFEMKSPTGSWVGRFYDGPAEWRWVFLSWADLTEMDLDGSRPDKSDITDLLWTYHTAGVRRVDYIVGWWPQDLRADFEVRGKGSQNLSGKFEAQVSLNLLGSLIVRNIGSSELSSQFDVGKDSTELFSRFEVGQGSQGLFGWFVVTLLVSESVDAGLAESLGWGDVLLQSEDLQDQIAESITFFPIKGSAELLGKFDAQTIQDLLARFEVGQDSQDLPASFEVGQDSAGLFSRFEVG